LSLKIIAAMAENRVIGKNNKMPWHVPEDLAFFKQQTMGKAVIMGRNTFLSIGGALPGRTNIVLSRDPLFRAEQIELAASLEQAAIKYPEAFIIGGAQLFAQALPKVDKLFITQIRANIDGDAFFPELDPREWNIEKTRQLQSVSGYNLEFYIYQRID